MGIRTHCPYADRRGRKANRRTDFGSEPELMGEMAHKIEDKGFSYIDINMGCPVPKIVNNKEGSA